MSVKKILKIGHPLLLEVSTPIAEFNTAELCALLEDMFDTMQAEDGAGLAAPQIGCLQRVVIFGVQNNPRYPQCTDIPETVLINPEMAPCSATQESDWEGCLSVPGMRGMVPRYSQIKYTGYDLLGNKIEREVEGFHARVVQHELDHLDGILYPQRIEDMRQFGYLDVLDIDTDC